MERSVAGGENSRLSRTKWFVTWGKKSVGRQLLGRTPGSEIQPGGTASGFHYFWLNFWSRTCSFGCFICPCTVSGGKQALLVPLTLNQLLHGICLCLSYTVHSRAGATVEARAHGHAVQASRVLPQETLSHVRDSPLEVFGSMLGLFATQVFKGSWWKGAQSSALCGGK